MLFWLLKWISIAALAAMVLFVILWVTWIRIRQRIELNRVRAELGARPARTAPALSAAPTGTIDSPLQRIGLKIGRWLWSWHGACEMLLVASIALTIITIANPGPAFIPELIDQAVSSASQSHAVQNISDAWNYVVYSGNPPADVVSPATPSPKPTWFWGWCAIISWFAMFLIFLIGFGEDCIRILKEVITKIRETYEKHEKELVEERKAAAVAAAAAAAQAQSERGRKGNKQPAPEPAPQAPPPHKAKWWQKNELLLAAVMDVLGGILGHYWDTRKGKLA